MEKKVLEDPAISADENFGAIAKKFCTFREGMRIFPVVVVCFRVILAQALIRPCSNFTDLDDISNCVDFIICLGGDGTLLYASSLFQVLCPQWVSKSDSVHCYVE